MAVTFAARRPLLARFRRAARTLARVIGVVAFSVLAGAAAAAEPVGAIEHLSGAAFVGRDGEQIALSRGAAVQQGDEIVTSQGARLIVRFVDRTSLTLGGSSRAVIQDVSESRTRFVLRMASGVFRVVTGLIGKAKPENVEVRTPVATIGIRGTHFGGEVDADSARIVLLPLEEGAANAITVTNEFGAVAIDEAGFGTEIPDGNSPPSAPRRMRLIAVEGLTRRAIRPPGLR